MKNHMHDRFKSAPWYDSVLHGKTVFIGGAGGIGSWTALLMVRAGFDVRLIDDDIIELHNLGGQLFKSNQVKMAKVDAMEINIGDFCNHSIRKDFSKVDEGTPANQFAIAAFDNMKARYDMYHKWKKYCINTETALFIDARLEAEQMWVHCIKGKDLDAMKRYEENELVLTDTDLPNAACTMKQTSHAAAMLAANIVGFFTNHIANLSDPDLYRFVPESWEYNIPLGIVTINENLNLQKEEDAQQENINELLSSH